MTVSNFGRPSHLLPKRFYYNQTFSQTIFEICLNYLFFNQFIQLNRSNDRYIRPLYSPRNQNVHLSQNIPCLNLLATDMVSKIVFLKHLTEFKVMQWYPLMLTEIWMPCVVKKTVIQRSWWRHVYTNSRKMQETRKYIRFKCKYYVFIICFLPIF